jgi:hypothetical protein
MHQDKSQEIVIITSEDGVWREEKISLGEEGPPDPRAAKPGIERGWSPWQWKRMFKEKMSPGYQEAMEGLRNADTRIARFSDELSYLANLLPKDPTKLPDIALVLMEIKQRLDSIVEAGKQVKPAKDKKLQDFYGRFHIKIPENLRTPGKIATAGIMGDFVRFLGRKIFELTDPDVREMKRVVAHLLNTTKQTVKSVNKTLDDMRSARKTGDVDRYIEGIKFIAKEQTDFRREFSMVYNSYLREPYEQAYALEQEEKAKAEAEGREFEKPFEEVVFEQGQAKVIEVDSPPQGESDPLEVAQDAEEPLEPHEIPRGFGPPEPSGEWEERYQAVPPTEDEPSTRRIDVEQVHRRQQEELEGPLTQRAPVTVDEGWPAGGPESQVETQPPQRREAPPKTLPSPRLEGGVGGEETPSSSELDIKPRYEWEAPTLPAELMKQQSVRVVDRASHARFLSELGEIAERENKYVVAAFMAKYSEKLEKTNPHASAALLKAAQEISND